MDAEKKKTEDIVEDTCILKVREFKESNYTLRWLGDGGGDDMNKQYAGSTGLATHKNLH